MKTPARQRWEAVTEDSPRQEYFDAMREALRESYLATDDPYRQSGRGKGRERWDESRHCHVEAIDRDGSYVDVGCANGLLLETLVAWARERGFVLEPFGVDFIGELVELARARLPDVPRDHFEEANALYWQPRRRFDYVHVNLEAVPARDRGLLVTRTLDVAVAPGGRLIASFYYPSVEHGQRDHPHPAALLRSLGLEVAGTADAIGALLAWTDKPPATSP